MEKYSKWRDPSTGVAPFLYPLSPASTDLSFPRILKVLTVPLSTILGATRTLLVVLLLLAQTILVEGVLSIFLVYPPLYAVLSRACNASISRLILFVLGIANISVETIRLAKTGRSPPQVAFEPKKGDLIVSNSSSYVDLLYLTFRHNATFLSPVLDPTTQKVSGWIRQSLLRAVWENGTIPSRTGSKGETLEEAIRNARGPVVLFPECTTSNNRALLKFPALSSSNSTKLSPSTKIYILTFKYSPPTPLTPSLTHPIPFPSLGPLPHLFTLLSSPSLQSLSVRRLHPSESSKKLEWETGGLEELVAATGRFKRLGGLGVREKEGFLEFRRMKGR
ncbi:lysophosphatidic acid acyltransferase LOA1 [Sporobolomyces salmoneus]|uniref:lysophosphatidic acid acyltransferase LOA1 n=1 Tax=Sporobolomyces salmoneus TaxID=183962 RepID=UPI00317035EB